MENQAVSALPCRYRKAKVCRKGFRHLTGTCCFSFSLDLHSWHKLLLQCNLSSSTELDNNSRVFHIFMCLLMRRILERNQHPSGREARARRICWEEPGRFARSLPSLVWLAVYSFIIISIKHEPTVQPKLFSQRCAALLPAFKEPLKFPSS